MDYVPALRGHLGDWEYYVTIMKLTDVANRVQFAEQLHPNKELASKREKFLVNQG
jgi:DNA sulfur modification protein DndB